MPGVHFASHVSEWAVVFISSFTPAIDDNLFFFLLGIQACASILGRGVDGVNEHKIAFHVLCGTELETMQGHNRAGFGP